MMQIRLVSADKGEVRRRLRRWLLAGKTVRRRASSCAVFVPVGDAVPQRDVTRFYNGVGRTMNQVPAGFRRKENRATRAALNQTLRNAVAHRLTDISEDGSDWDDFLDTPVHPRTVRYWYW